MEILDKVSLAEYTTFKIGGRADYFCRAKTLEDIRQAVKHAEENGLPFFILGAGSNMLVSDSGFAGLVVKVELLGKEVAYEDQQRVEIRLAAGEIWDEAVAWTVENNWWGIENLSHIPGLCGSIAIQNVGAYGQEAAKVIVSVSAYDADNDQVFEFAAADCNFGYRSSLFNQKAAGRYVVLSVKLGLSKLEAPNLAYRDLSARFASQKPSLQQIRRAVIEIRDSKYPFPKEAKNGNAGSFFKNSHLSLADYAAVKKNISENISPAAAEVLDKKVFRENQAVKIPSAALLEAAGLLGASEGGAMINPRQPLVIINRTGSATAADVLSLAKKVVSTVRKKTGILLKIEPVFLGFSSDELKGLER